MKTSSTLVALLLSAAIAQAEDDPTGTWKWEVGTAPRTTTVTVRLRLDGNKLTGVYIGRLSGETPLHDTSFVEGKVVFVLKRETGKSRAIIEHSGTLKGDTITGTIKTTDEFNGRVTTSSRAWEAKRQK